MYLLKIKSIISNKLDVIICVTTAYNKGMGSIFNLIALSSIRFQAVCRFESYWTTRTFAGYQSVRCLWLVWGLSSMVASISVLMFDMDHDFVGGYVLNLQFELKLNRY